METEALPAFAGNRWYYACNDSRIGPLSLDDLRTAIASSFVSPETIVWRNGMTDWMPAQSLPELAIEFELPPPLPAKIQIIEKCATTMTFDSINTSNEGSKVKSAQDAIPDHPISINHPDDIKPANRIVAFGGYLALFLIITISMAVTISVVLNKMGAPDTLAARDRAAGGMVWAIPGIIAAITFLRRLTKTRCRAVLKSNPSAGRSALLLKGYCMAVAITMLIMLASSSIAAGISPDYERALREAHSCALFFVLLAMLFAISIPFRAFRNTDAVIPEANRTTNYKPLFVILSLCLGLLAFIFIRSTYFLSAKTTPPQGAEDTQFSKTLNDMKAVRESATDDMQKRIDAINSGAEPVDLPIAERMNKINRVANSATGYSGLVVKEGTIAIEKLSILNQEYQEACKNLSAIPKHDLKILNEYKQSLVQIKSSIQKINTIVKNWRTFIEKEIPIAPDPIPFDNFDQSKYTVARMSFIDGASKTVNQTTLAYYETEEKIWDASSEKTDFLITNFLEWEVNTDGVIVFENESDVDKFNSLQLKCTQAGQRSLELMQKMVNERRDKERKGKLEKSIGSIPTIEH